MDPKHRISSSHHDSIAPSSMKSISDSKIKSFESGLPPKTTLSRKEQEDLRRKMEEKERQEVFRDFVASFEPANKLGKTFIKGGTFNPGSHEESPQDKGKAYRPAAHSSRFSDSSTPHRTSSHTPIKKEPTTPTTVYNTKTMETIQQQAIKNAASLADNKPKIKSEKEKRKSNLESFKEELKRIQEERDRRHTQKQREKDGKRTRFEPLPVEPMIASELALDSESLHQESRYASDDPGTTNIFLSNLNRSLNELSIMEIFGQFGPLASIKIMYPRTEEEKSRGSNCGFVAYMSRKDAERAIAELDGRELGNLRIRLSWGRAVHIPPQPVYIPPSMRELIQPPPPSGLPFNAQPNTKYSSSKHIDMQKYVNGGIISKYDRTFEKLLEYATVKVVIPQDKPLLCLIHRMIEFVVREGPLFEACIMNKEMNNAQYRFLFENQSSAHLYYRWKLFSVIQGDSVSSWRTEPFKMFTNGSTWIPPPLNQYTQGMPDEAFEKAKQEYDGVSAAIKRGRLSDSQRDHLEDLLRSLTPERPKIGDAMLYCIDHAEAAEEIVDCIAESLSILQTPTHRKIARLYLISDVLHNCSVRVTNASYFRRGFEAHLADIFKNVHDTWKEIDGKLKAEQFKQKIMNIFRAWEGWAIYSSEFLIKLQNIFLGLVKQKPTNHSDNSSDPTDPGAFVGSDEEIDGKPVAVDVDGKPLALVADYDDEEIDGKPILKSRDDDIDGKPLIDNTTHHVRSRFSEEINDTSESSTVKPRFVQTKWETVDPSKLVEQAVTTSKWDLFDEEKSNDEVSHTHTKSKAKESLYEDIGEEEELSRKQSSNTSTASMNMNTSEQSDVQNATNPHTNRINEDIYSNSNSRGDDTKQSTLTSVVIPHSTNSTGGGFALTGDTGESKAANEERRQKLRDIEVKVLKYQDELECGRRDRKHGLSLTEEIEFYRQKLLKKECEHDKQTTSYPTSLISSDNKLLPSYSSNDSKSFSSKSHLNTKATASTSLSTPTTFSSNSSNIVSHTSSSSSRHSQRNKSPNTNWEKST
ncbi:unnamed protein product [Didymodactylos carnosus]|uniref:U2 snRNP-associated SURP motif-containing protein n=1 Tax=Didymodactylos carnosus TaxID=1234261 RepID=A0A814BAB2_9BILA|nr:unnamed protein product [Didymodactylos carnosus]CAF0924267.1 unnamed protein product [Didymodactylos carnosus]CAF3538400.1 unnamed protein product [Didymodactylos carnosus]CAF3703212.1 unnamed protein product [Didymodactylos carnosus]